MRKGLTLLVLLASLALVLPGSAQSPTNNNFVTGYTPQNIVFKPIDMTANVKPMNIQQGMMPQQNLGPKVFDISSVFHSIHFPSATPTRVTGQTIIKPGPNNTVQLPKTTPPKPKS
jgi:hypothetical protein